MPSTTASDLLTSLLPEWHQLLQGWAANRRLTAAAQESLMLDGEPQALKELVGQWATGDFSAIPPIVLLSSGDISGAMGAYAISTGTIYLNADWLAATSREQVFAVLTEELGHHLDGLLNAIDAPGDEGEYFSKTLLQSTILLEEGRTLRAQTDTGRATAGSQPVNTEFSTGIILTTKGIQADSMAGDIVGALSAEVTNGPVTYELISGTGDEDNTFFIIDGDRLKIRSNPDQDSRSSYNIRIRATYGNGAAIENSFGIRVNNQPGRPESWTGSVDNTNVYGGYLYYMKGVDNSNFEFRDEGAGTSNLTLSLNRQEANCQWLSLNSRSAISQYNWKGKLSRLSDGATLDSKIDAVFSTHVFLSNNLPTFTRSVTPGPNRSFSIGYAGAEFQFKITGNYTAVVGGVTKYGNISVTGKAYSGVAADVDSGFNSIKKMYWYGNTGGNQFSPLISTIINGVPITLSSSYFYWEAVIGDIEIPLARRNNLPASFPTILGSFTQGSTIAIDPTTINDPDNSAAFTPIYHYGFEVSEDGGRTWRRLTSMDAENGDNAYILMPEDVKNAFRGIVTFVDELGNTETVETESLSTVFADGRNGIGGFPLTAFISFSSTAQEGQTLTTTINLSAGTQTTGNLAEGAQVWWKVTGITADDLDSGALTGSGTIVNGQLVLTHKLKVDTAIENENFQVSVFSDAAMTVET